MRWQRRKRYRARTNLLNEQKLVTTSRKSGVRLRGDLTLIAGTK